MHSTLGYVSPIQFEQQWHRTTQAMASRPGGEYKTGYGKAGKQTTLSNFPTAMTTTNYNQLWDTDSESKVTRTAEQNGLGAPNSEIGIGKLELKFVN